MKNNWFEEWFNSEYYHLLYDYRDVSEAELFIQNIVNFLSLSKKQKIIDVGCGQGRHALSLSSRGFEVTGIDLSHNNIEQAKQQCDGKTEFAICDMRTPYKKSHYDLVLNLFTSFGYFENEEDNMRSMQSMSECLKPGGTLILDYFNASKVKAELSLPEKTFKTNQGISFETVKYIERGFVIKDIFVTENGNEIKFKEKVKLIDLESFKSLVFNTGLELIEIFGDYNLSAFDVNKSERLIILAIKK